MTNSNENENICECGHEKNKHIGYKKYGLNTCNQMFCGCVLFKPQSQDAPEVTKEELTGSKNAKTNFEHPDTQIPCECCGSTEKNHDKSAPLQTPLSDEMWIDSNGDHHYEEKDVRSAVLKLKQKVFDYGMTGKRDLDAKIKLNIFEMIKEIFGEELSK